MGTSACETRKKPERFFLAHSQESGADRGGATSSSTPSTARRCASDARPLYLERFIHAAIYEARPDVMAVVHAHAEDVLPFTITQAALSR